MNKIIIAAIEKKLIIELRYHGYARIVEPHAYGRDKSGEEILRCYQVSGGSESGEREGWKLLKIRDIFSIHDVKKSFTQRQNYKKNDKAMEYMFCQI